MNGDGLHVGVWSAKIDNDIDTKGFNSSTIAPQNSLSKYPIPIDNVGIDSHNGYHRFHRFSDNHDNAQYHNSNHNSNHNRNNSSNNITPASGTDKINSIIRDPKSSKAIAIQLCGFNFHLRADNGHLLQSSLTSFKLVRTFTFLVRRESVLWLRERYLETSTLYKDTAEVRRSCPGLSRFM